MNKLTSLSFVIFLSTTVTASADDDLVSIGKAAFSDCQPCHVLSGPATNAKPAPSLNNLIGRKPGGLDEAVYSLAMVRFGEDHVWDKPTLTAFLRSPNDVVPGTNMKFVGMKDDERIRALLAYLETVD